MELSEGVAGGTEGGRSDQLMTLRVVTMNVDGLGEYQASPSARMEAVLAEILTAMPDVILLQEVTAEMHAVVRLRLAPEAGWKVYRRHEITEDYFNVSAVRIAVDTVQDKTTSYAFRASDNGRHYVTVRRKGWTIVNVHAESGGRAEQRDNRCAQLLHMSRVHEQESGQVCVLAGDFNARAGEDLCLCAEGWRDVGRDGEWTWRRGDNAARYDRVYARAMGSGAVECVRVERLRSVWNSLSDHMALCVVLRVVPPTPLRAGAVQASGAPAAALPAPCPSVSPPQADIPVVKIASAALAVDSAFCARAASCLRHLEDESWTPDAVELLDSDPAVAWDDVPTECGFKVARPLRSGGGQARADSERRRQDCVAYAKYRKWARQACGITEAELKEYLKRAQALHRDRRGSEGIPEAFRRRDMKNNRVAARAHAVLLCRVGGLRRAAAGDDVAELGEGLHGTCATKEFDRLLALSCGEVEAEFARLPLRMRADLGPAFYFDASAEHVPRAAVILVLFRRWLFAQSAAKVGAEDEWNRLSSAAVAGETDAPLRFALDGEIFDVLPAEIPGAGARSGTSPSGDPLSRAWWRLAWDAACEEVRRRGCPPSSCQLRGRLRLVEARGEGGAVATPRVSCTARELYEKIFKIPTDEVLEEANHGTKPSS